MWTLQCRAPSQVRESFPGSDVSWNSWLASLRLCPNNLMLFAGECLTHLHDCLQGPRGTVKNTSMLHALLSTLFALSRILHWGSFPVSSTVQFSMQLVAPNSIAKMIPCPTFRRGKWSFHYRKTTKLIQNRIVATRTLREKIKYGILLALLDIYNYSYFHNYSSHPCFLQGQCSLGRQGYASLWNHIWLTASTLLAHVLHLSEDSSRNLPLWF